MGAGLAGGYRLVGQTGLAPIKPAMAIKHTPLNTANAKVNFGLPTVGAVRRRLTRANNQNQLNAAKV
ncbi:hypothetical protein D3C78_1851120 [compost metagenome]